MGTAILSAFRDYRIKRAADPESAAKLTEMLDELYEKGKKKNLRGKAEQAFRFLDKSGDGEIRTREIKHFLRQVCGLKSDDQIDETRDSAKYFVSFFDADDSRGVDLDEFCKVFLDGTNFSTHEEANTLLTAILSAFRDYKSKRAADPERAAKLTEMLDQLYEKGKKKTKRK